jgi:hypothetical protein
MPFFEIPLFLLLFALQTSASRREGMVWKGLDMLLTVSASIGILWLLYLRTLIDQPGRTVNAYNGVRMIALGSSAYVASVAQHAVTQGIVGTLAIVLYGFVARFGRERAAHVLAIVEIISWLVFLVVATLFTVLAIKIANSGFNH